MRFSFLLSYVCVALHSNFHVSSEVANDGNLFLDSDFGSESDSLFLDDASSLIGDAGDIALELASLPGESISTDFDWTDRTDPSGSDDLCKVAEEFQYTGKIRARGDANSCSSPDSTTNLLQLPGLSDLENLIQGMGRRPKTTPQEIPYPPPLTIPPTPQEEKPCVPPWPLHLCCIYPEYDKVVVESGTRVYAVARQCTPST